MRRHMTSVSCCPKCVSVLESNLHAIRDCSFSKAVWLSLLPVFVQGTFFSLSHNSWLSWNLRNTMKWREEDFE